MPMIPTNSLLGGETNSTRTNELNYPHHDAVFDVLVLSFISKNTKA